VRAIRAERGINADVGTVINRCESGLFGGVARRDHVDRIVGAEQLFYVRNTSIALECVNRGESLTMAPSDKGRQGHRSHRGLGKECF
jgi:hypothetical protein